MAGHIFPVHLRPRIPLLPHLSPPQMRHHALIILILCQSEVGLSGRQMKKVLCEQPRVVSPCRPRPPRLEEIASPPKKKAGTDMSTLSVFVAHCSLSLRVLTFGCCASQFLWPRPLTVLFVHFHGAHVFGDMQLVVCVAPSFLYVALVSLLVCLCARAHACAYVPPWRSQGALHACVAVCTILSPQSSACSVHARNVDVGCMLRVLACSLVMCAHVTG